MAKIPPKPLVPQAEGRLKWMGIMAIAAAVLLALAMGLMVYKAITRPNAPLPASPATNVPVPSGLPEVNQPNLPQAALPETKVPSLPEAPVTKVEPPPAPEPEPTGTVSWKWQLYELNPTLIDVGMQGVLPGQIFVSLGVTVYNQSTANVEVSNEKDEFTINVDNVIYKASLWSTGASALIRGIPVLAPATLAPNGNIAGQMSYLIPGQFKQITINWQTKVPKGVQVVRIDPKQPIIWLPRQAQPNLPKPKAEDE